MKTNNDFERKLKTAEIYFSKSLKSGDITKKSEHKKLSSIYFGFSKGSLETADILYDISGDKVKKGLISVDDSYEAYMWVTVTSYYSMFYMASALLAKKQFKIGSNSTHENVKCAFLYLYISQGQLKKELGIEYQKTKELAESLMQERKKRYKCQYDMGIRTLKSDAKESLKNAKTFFETTRTILSRK